jgi:type II secretory pathway component PulF
MKERKELVAIVAGVIVIVIVVGIYLTMFMISS